MLAAFTDHTLPILANWSQLLGGITLVTAVAGWYGHHRCFHCRRLARFKVGDHQVPVCHRHRQREQAG
jgi:hypothetical protein